MVMSAWLPFSQLSVKQKVPLLGNDLSALWAVALRMRRPVRIHTDKQPRRLHYIPEWAERRGLSQADIVRELASDANKSTVSRWFSGSIPQDKHIVPLAEVLCLDDPTALFRHPDDDWMARFLKGRDAEERERIRATLEAAFPKKVA
jgi:transcriptional regulator with XRE-family HTH domain